jgi:hypothetical protein
MVVVVVQGGLVSTWGIDTEVLAAVVGVLVVLIRVVEIRGGVEVLRSMDMVV